MKSRWQKGEWTSQEEAEAITAFVVRLGWSEALEGYNHLDALEKPKPVSRMRESEMKDFLRTAASKMQELMLLKENNPKEYWDILSWMNHKHCHDWVNKASAKDAEEDNKPSI